MSKNIFNLLYVCLFVFLVSCAEDDQVQISDPAVYPHQVGFNELVETVEINEGQQTAYLLEIATTDIVEQDIVVQYSIQEESASLGEDFLTLNSSGSVTILPGARKAAIAIQPIDDEEANEDKVFYVNLTSTSLGELGYRGEEFSLTRRIVIVNDDCPIATPDEFIGDYMLEQTSEINPDSGVPVFNEQVITLTADGSLRSFEAVYLEGLDIGQPAATFIFSLDCFGEVSIPEEIPTSLTCGSGGITLGPSDELGSYTVGDDTSFTIIFDEYETDGGCDAEPFKTTFTLTKI